MDRASCKTQLSYNKCVSCRSAKKKCLPVDRAWPGQKCDRCDRMDLPCSESLRARTADISVEKPVPAAQLTLSLTEHTNFQDFLDLSVRVASLRQLIRFVRSAEVIDTDLAKIYPDRYRSPAKLDDLRSHIHTEADNTVKDIEALIERRGSFCNDFVALSALHLLMRLQSSLDRNDEIYKTVPAHSVPMEHSRRIGDLGATVMMQETILIRMTRNQAYEAVNSELRKYLNIHREFARRVKGPIVPPLHYLLVLVNDNWILDAEVSLGRGWLSEYQDEDLLGRSLLHLALDEIPSPNIDLLLGRGLRIGSQDAFGRSVMHIVCMHGSIDAVKMLIQYVPLITAPGPMACQPLHLAVGNGDIPITKLLLANPSVCPNCEDDSGMTPLSHAARKDDWQMVQLLLSQQNIAANHMDKSGMTPLLYAVQNNNERLVRQLLLRDDVLSDHPETHPPVLSHLVLCGNLEMIKLLSAGHNDPGFEVGSQIIPLLSANEEGYKHMVELFLHRYHRPHPGSLRFAARLGYCTVVKLLITFRLFDPDHEDRHGRTPLSYAAEGLFPREHADYDEVVRLLLARRIVHPDFADCNDKTPLMYAAERGHEIVVRRLLDTGMVLIHNQDKFGETALSYALRNGHHAVASLLQYERESRKIERVRYWVKLRGDYHRLVHMDTGLYPSLDTMDSTEIDL